MWQAVIIFLVVYVILVGLGVVRSKMNFDTSIGKGKVIYWSVIVFVVLLCFVLIGILL